LPLTAVQNRQTLVKVQGKVVSFHAMKAYGGAEV